MEEVRVVSSRVFIWPGIHAEVGENVAVLAQGARQAFVFTDRKCIPIAKRVALSLLQANFDVAGYAMYPGEARKDLRTARGVFSKMARTRRERDCVFVTVGGGVVTDLGGFVASTYLGGVRLFHVPTTLVAQVDASIGRTATLNLKEGRNRIAVGHPATAVFADPTLLKTLPRREYLEGLAEVVRYGMTREADLLASLEESIDGVEERAPLLLEEIVYRCASIRASLEGEGVPDVLGYGLTVGRALEAAGGYSKIRHGEATAVGMEAEAWISERMGIAPAGVPKAQNRILRRLDLPTRVRGLPAEKVLEAMKEENGDGAPRLLFSLPEAVGQARAGVAVPADLLEAGVRSVLLPGSRIRAARPMAETS